MNFEINSPVEELHDPLFKLKGIHVYIKRDDLIHPYISGNKWRKLKYNLQHASETGKTQLVTFGGVWSNHLVATACAAATFGFSSTGIVRGEDVPSLALTLCRIFGMKLQFVSREAYRDKEGLFNSLYTESDKACFIDEGGAGPFAVQGCRELAAELSDCYDHVFCASGTGTTAAGIALGLQHLNSRMHIIPVLRDQGSVAAAIAQYGISPQHINVHREYHFGGYAKTSPQLMQFIMRFGASTGILLDPIYTGKAMYALYDLIEKDHFREGESLLFIHTGGLIGIAGKTSEFGSI